MGRTKKKLFDLKGALESLLDLVDRQPLLPFAIPALVLLWAFEKCFFCLSNWVLLLLAVWATIQYGSYQRRYLVEDLNKKWMQLTLQNSPVTPLEHCEWLNKLLIEVWSNYINPKLSLRFASIVEEKIELQEFSLGSRPPLLGLHGTRWSMSGDQATGINLKDARIEVEKTIGKRVLELSLDGGHMMGFLGEGESAAAARVLKDPRMEVEKIRLPMVVPARSPTLMLPKVPSVRWFGSGSGKKPCLWCGGVGTCRKNHCRLIDEEFKNMRVMVDIYRKPKERYRCVVCGCGARFGDSAALLDHYTKVHEAFYKKCEFFCSCGCAFKDKDSLDDHKKRKDSKKCTTHVDGERVEKRKKSERKGCWRKKPKH